VRLTVTVTEPLLCATAKLDPESSRLPTAGAASPLMLTVAVVGLPRVTPAVGPDNVTVNDLLPKNGVALLMATDTVFGAASPSAHERLPLVSVKSVPATAVPLDVA